MSEKIEFEAIVQYISGNMRGLVGVPYGKLPMGQRYKVTLEPVEPELAPCRYCLESYAQVENQSSDISECYQVRCLGCGAGGPQMKTREQAIEEWNRRRGEYPKVWY